MVSFQIKFNKSNKKYKSGDLITCSIEIDVYEIFRADSLLVQFKGEAYTEWKAKLTNLLLQRFSSEETFVGDQLYFAGERYLERFDSQAIDYVESGVHEYTVSFTLPSNLPPSFSHEKGHITYTVTVVYETPCGVDKTYSETFYIVPDLKMSDYPQFLERIRIIKEKQFGVCRFEPRTLYLINILPKSGYEPGETIILTVELMNQSRTKINWVRVRLVERLTFTFKKPKAIYKTYNHIILENTFERGVKALKDKIFQATFFLDPNYPWKYLNKFGIISCEYFIETKAGASGLHLDPVHTTGITIGTVSTNDSQVNSENVSAVFNPSIRGVVMEQPLPSYEDALLAR